MMKISELPADVQAIIKNAFIDYISGKLEIDSAGWSIPDSIKIVNDPKTDNYILLKYQPHKDKEHQVAVFHLEKEMTNQWLKEDLEE